MASTDRTRLDVNRGVTLSPLAGAGKPLARRGSCCGALGLGVALMAFACGEGDRAVGFQPGPVQAGVGVTGGTGVAGMAPPTGGSGVAGMAPPAGGTGSAGVTAGTGAMTGSGGTTAGTMGGAGMQAGGTGGSTGGSGGGPPEPMPDAGVEPDAGPSDAGEPDSGSPVVPLRKFVGNITTRGQVRSDFADYWDQITPENEGKWGSVEGTRDQMNWAGLDRVYQYAKEHRLPFKQHTLVWGSQQPNWLGGLSQQEQREEVEEWIRLFCERYPDTQMIDVVNEPPPHTTPVYAQALGGAGQSGYDWIVQSFKWARQYCPNAILILNDYNNIEYSADNTRFIAIAKAVKAAGAPIDAVGAQAHDAYKHPVGTVKGMLDKLANETGLPVYISEYDINLASDSDQARVMREQFTMFWEHDKVEGITLWGYVSGATWLANTGLMSSAGSERPALTWLKEYLGR